MAVYKKDNRWYIDYYGPDGKRKREVVTIKGIDSKHVNRQDALKALSIRKGEIAQGKFDIAKPKRQILFEKLMEMYLEWADTHHRVPGKDITVSNQLVPYFKGKYINKINLWLVDGYVSLRKKQGKKAGTINKELGILRRMFNLAVDWGLLTVNPIQGISKKLVKDYQFKAKIYQDWEFQRLYQAAPGHFKPILLCAYVTGMRKSEIRNLKWEDIDFDTAYIRLTKTKNYEPRDIPISRSLLDTLTELKKTSENEFVFTINDKPFKLSAWETAWQKTREKSGLGACRFHDIRHTFISNLIVRDKEDFATVMALSGHKDVGMLKRYTQTREEAKKMAISRLDRNVNLETIDTYLDTKPSFTRQVEIKKSDVTT